MTKKIQRQVAQSGVPDHGQVGQRALFTERILVVNQRAKIFGINTEYAVYDQSGQRIGAFQEVGQRLIKKAIGVGGERGTHRFRVVDPTGRVLIALHRPARLLKSKMTIMGANGTHGEIVQQNLGVFGKVRFSLESGDQKVGSINAEDWQQWDFSIRDAAGAEVARITKTWAGWAKERFTKTDNYVVQFHRPLEEPLRSLAISAALAVDTALKQGNQTSKPGLTRRYE
ncbi:LURP-one-related/scramblase family protein [Nocardioides salsibiostraticola]